MKNLICILLLLFCSLFFCNISFARTNDDKTTIEIKNSLLKFEKQKNSKYDLVAYDSYGFYNGSSFDYKIKKYKVNGKTIYIAKNEYDIVFYSPDEFVSEILPKYYDFFDNIKFINYPNTGTIKYIIKSKKGFGSDFYTLASVNSNYVILKKIDKERPRLYNCDFDDKNSIIYNLLNISYTKIPIGNYFYFDETIPAFIDEEVKIENNKIYLTYKDISFKSYSKPYTYPNIVSKKEKIYFPVGFYNYIHQLKNIQELFARIEKETPYKFINYPQDFMIINLSSNLTGCVEIIFFENGKQINKISDEYLSVYSPDYNMFINKVSNFYSNTGISYQNSNRIIVKNKDKKWGIIDKNNKVKVPFEYDKILSIGNNVNEQIINADDKKAKQLIVKYMGQSREYNMFFAIKDNQIGVINDKNEILVDFEPLKNPMDIDENILNKSVTKDVNSAKLSLKTGYIIKILTIPLWLPLFVLCMYSII